MLYLLKQLSFSKKKKLLPEFYHPAKFELKRIKSAKVVPRFSCLHVSWPSVSHEKLTHLNRTGAFCNCFTSCKLAKTFILKLKCSSFIRNNSLTERKKSGLIFILALLLGKGMQPRNSTATCKLTATEDHYISYISGMSN